jgi:hypothetical protein
MFATRSAWNGTESDALIAAAESSVKGHSAYRAAKSGALDEAWRLASEVLASVRRERLDAAMAGASILAPVHAFEGLSINRIPAAMGHWLSEAYRVPVENSLVQLNRVGHTGSSGWKRLAHQALFAGNVVPGASYVLVDDFVGQGGTLANLRGFILAHGGKVSGFISLTGNPVRSAKIALAPESLSSLRAKHAELESWWREHFGFGFDALTESEGRYLLRVNADTIRSRIFEAGQGAIA